MLYHNYEMQRLALAPMRLLANNALRVIDLPFNPFRATPFGRVTAAVLDSFEHSTRRFGKPRFGHETTVIDGTPVPVVEEVVDRRTWCDLKHFRRETERPNDPRVLIVAPMSGHFATLLRGTVEALLPDHDVHITDWKDARQVPVSSEDFSLDDYIGHVIDYMRMLGPDLHVIAVCQPAVPVLAAAALMNEAGDNCAPRTMTLIGGPVDTREAPTKVNQFAKSHSIEWFRRHVIHPVPFGNPGFMRLVYPGFVQLAGFMTMNLDRHVTAHFDMFKHLVRGDGESAAAHRRFYDEYLSVMDLPADFYLQTIKQVFQDHELPLGTFTSRGRPVEPRAIEKTALFTVEGEKDDICAVGQTEAAQDLCAGLPKAKKRHYVQPMVGHYGVFNGSRWRNEIYPKVRDFIRTNG